jgi:predicted restriction endonuclease
MIRYSIFTFSVLGMAATAIAHVIPLTSQNPGTTSHGTSIVYQTAMATTVHPLILQKCALEDCSDTPQ